MTPERLIELAKQAGSPYRNRHYKDVVTYGFSEEHLIAFANLIAAECERERDVFKQCNRTSYDALATVTKQRDELRNFVIERQLR